jgi:hypothetical protein
MKQSPSPSPAIPLMRLHPTSPDDLLSRHPSIHRSPENIHLNELSQPLIQIGFWGPDNSNLLHHNSDSDNPASPFVEESGCFFNLAACWTRGPRTEGQGLVPSFTHCELRFANGYVCSIHEYILVARPTYDDAVPERLERVPGHVHCRIRELDRKDYFFVEMPVTTEQHEKMFRQACMYAHKKIPFNGVGMYLNFVAPFRWFPTERNGEAFFCSELVSQLMRDANVIPGDVHPSTTSPNSLWTRLNQLDNAFPSYNRNSIAQSVLGALVVPSGRRQLFTLPRNQ